MNANNNAQTVLFFSERDYTILPYSTNAFQVSEGPRRRLLQKFVGTLIVYRDCSVARLEGIQFLGLHGENAWSRAFSFLNGGNRRISVTLRPLLNFRFEQVRNLTLEYLRRRPDVIEDYFDQTAAPYVVADLVAKSSTCAELFDALGVPEPQDTLDSLGGVRGG